MKALRTRILLSLPVMLIVGINGVVGAEEDRLPSWNGGAVKKSIVAFVENVTEKGSADFIPPAERIAVFDNDGTLWAEQPIYFQLAFTFDRIKALAPQHPEWKTREPFASLLQGDMKGALAGGELAILQIVMATHAGMTTDEFEAIVKEWMATATHPRFKRAYTDVVYQPMLELLSYLRANGFKTYIASAGGVEFMRAVAEQIYGIPPEQVIGSSIKTSFEVRDGKPALARLPELDFIDEKAGKPVGIHKFIGRRPILAFGNSDGDLQMLQWIAAGAGARFMGLIRHTDAEREWAYDRQSPIGKLDKALDEATAKGWTVVDTKKDWNRVFAFDEAVGNTPSAASNLTGVKWHVTELSGHPIAASLQGEQPFIIFDATKQQVTGYAGCNRFFGGYELEGTALKFGPIGSTKRACPHLEEEIETEFFKTLEATATYKIVDEVLGLHDATGAFLAKFGSWHPR